MNRQQLLQIFWNSLDRHPEIKFNREDGLLCWALDHFILDSELHAELRSSYVLATPARIAYTTYGVGIPEEEVIRAAQAMYEQDFQPSHWVSVEELMPEEDTVLECVVIKDGRKMRKYAWLCGHDNQFYYVIDGELSMMIPIRDATVTHWRLATRMDV